MTVRELLTKVRDKLQDTDSVYWSDSELLDLYNECKRFLSAERIESPTKITLDLISTDNTYTVDNVLRYLSIVDSNGNDRALYPDDNSGDNDTSGVIVEDYNRIYVNEPEDGVTLSIKCVSFPDEDNLNDVIRLADENSYIYYILGKAYEKDNDMEQFQKASYFLNQFAQSYKFNKKNTSLNHRDNSNTVKSWYF